MASADGRVMVTLGRDQDVRVWDVGVPPPVVTSIADLDRAFFGVAASPDGAAVAVGDGDGTVHVLRGGDDDLELTGHEGRVRGVAFLPSDRLVTGDAAGTVRVWDLQSGRMLSASDATDVEITSVAVDDDGTSVATSGADGVVRVYAASDMQARPAETERAPASANKVVFTASGELVAGYNDGQVRFWERDGSRARSPLQVDDDADVVFSVAVTPDERTLAAATATDGITLWDLDTGERHQELNGQPTDPLDVAFVSGGDALVSTNRTGTVALWNTATGQSIGPRFQYHSDAVWRVAVADARVITAGEDGSVVSLDVLDVDRACEFGGSLDRRARERYLGDRAPLGCRD